MGNFDEAVKALLLSQRICPRCKASNIPHASPTITEEPNGALFCATCAHVWTVKS